MKTTKEKILSYLKSGKSKTVSMQNAKSVVRNTDVLPESVMRKARELYSEGALKKVSRGTYKI